MVTANELREYVRSRGNDAEAIFNTVVALEGKPLEVMGYMLKGPRGNKKVIGRDPDGSFSEFLVKLWCDGVDYSTRKIRAR